MKAFILYHTDSEFARTVEEYVSEFKRVTGHEIELQDLNTIEGADMAKLYDIMQNPSLLAVRDDGQLAQMWQGTPLPLMNEVLGYINS
jgi:hypothetical protein